MLRELTKLHESAYRGTVAELVAMAESGAIEPRGECVVVVAGRPVRTATDVDMDTVDARIDELLTADRRVRDVAETVHDELGIDRRAAYDRVVARRETVRRSGRTPR